MLGPTVRCQRRRSASATGLHPHERRCPSHGGDDAGTIARRKPMRAASARRRRAWATWRTSPPRPISPITTTSGPIAWSVAALATAIATRGRRPARRAARHRPWTRRRPRSAPRQPGPPLEHGEQQRQAAAVEPLGVAPRRRRRVGSGRSAPGPRRAAGGGPRASARRPSRRRRARRSARNSFGGSGTPVRPALGHLEQAELVGRAEAVLDRPQQAQGVVAVALERQHGVDDVLEHAADRPARRPS